ncbi:MAG: cobalt-precorrin-5B (C(1))-methyltransferase CbiD [Oscillospiraceae bacterium]|nr:cobalt-precorrin-5B (C(1))-methyltransferase CbiD [Oscillospiraceae bacterium]
MKEYIRREGKLLRCGVTTGTCAAAAAGAAVRVLLGAQPPAEIQVSLPGGGCARLTVSLVWKTQEEACCAVKKDAGDDPDITDGAEIRARVSLCSGSGVHIEGGRGVGRVTKPGLDQPVGAAAINSVPRAMIEREALRACREAGYTGGLSVTVEIPQGEELAKKTFNPHMGIVGGLSVLGTSGIVEPMSEQALVGTIRAEVSLRAASGRRYLAAVPGNYGERFAQEQLHLPRGLAVTCSNYIGEVIDLASEYGFRGVLLVGHIGKLCKLGAGLMNTHSRFGDARMEILSACAVEAGAQGDTLRQVLSCVTADEALNTLERAEVLEGSLQALARRAEFYLKKRAGDGVAAEALIFSQKRGLLCGTAGAQALLSAVKGETV